MISFVYVGGEKHILYENIKNTSTASTTSTKASVIRCQADGNAIGMEIGDTTTTSTEQQIAPLENIQNLSQISQDGDSGVH